MRVGYLACSFDVLNISHLDVVAQALGGCDRLVVGVLPDDQVEGLTGRPPVIPLDERIALIGHVRGVSAAVVHGARSQSDVGADVTFVVDDEVVPGLTGATRLRPRRRSTSVLLVAALSRGDSQVVA